MKYLDKDGVSHLWAKIKDKLSYKVDKVDGKGLSTNDYDNTSKNKVDKIVLNGDGNGFLANDGTYKAVDLSDIENRLDGLENLGQYVGTFDTQADIPTNVSSFDKITLNDFVNIRADETKSNVPTRYIAKQINRDTGAITWEYDISFSSDISGKMDKVTNPTKDKIMIDDGNGNAVNGDKTIAELIADCTELHELDNFCIDFKNEKPGILVYPSTSISTLCIKVSSNGNTNAWAMNNTVYYFKAHKDAAEGEAIAIYGRMSGVAKNEYYIGVSVVKKSGDYVTIASNEVISLKDFLRADKEATITKLFTFSVLPQSSVVPTTNNQLTNKKYVDDQIKTIEAITTAEIDEICADETV